MWGESEEDGDVLEVDGCAIVMTCFMPIILFPFPFLSF